MYANKLLIKITAHTATKMMVNNRKLGQVATAIQCWKLSRKKICHLTGFHGVLSHDRIWITLYDITVEGGVRKKNQSCIIYLLWSSMFDGTLDFMLKYFFSEHPNDIWQIVVKLRQIPVLHNLQKYDEWFRNEKGLSFLKASNTKRKIIQPS